MLLYWLRTPRTSLNAYHGGGGGRPHSLFLSRFSKSRLRATASLPSVILFAVCNQQGHGFGHFDSLFLGLLCAPLGPYCMSRGLRSMGHICRQLLLTGALLSHPVPVSRQLHSAPVFVFLEHCEAFLGSIPWWKNGPKVIPTPPCLGPDAPRATSPGGQIPHRISVGDCSIDSFCVSSLLGQICFVLGDFWAFYALLVMRLLVVQWASKYTKTRTEGPVCVS